MFRLVSLYLEFEPLRLVRCSQQGFLEGRANTSAITSDIIEYIFCIIIINLMLSFPGPPSPMPILTFSCSKHTYAWSTSPIHYHIPFVRYFFREGFLQWVCSRDISSVPALMARSLPFTCTSSASFSVWLTVTRSVQTVPKPLQFQIKVHSLSFSAHDHSRNGNKTNEISDHHLLQYMIWYGIFLWNSK